MLLDARTTGWSDQWIPWWVEIEGRTNRDWWRIFLEQRVLNSVRIISTLGCSSGHSNIHVRWLTYICWSFIKHGCLSYFMDRLTFSFFWECRTLISMKRPKKHLICWPFFRDSSRIKIKSSCHDFFFIFYWISILGTPFWLIQKKTLHITRTLLLGV